MIALPYNLGDKTIDEEKVPQHTPGLLWALGSKTTGGCPRILSHSGPIANLRWTGGSKVADATAFRLVGCYNACEGIDPKTIPEMHEELMRLRQNKADLLGVLSITKSNLKSILGSQADKDKSVPCLEEIIGDIGAVVAAIAKTGEES